MKNLLVVLVAVSMALPQGVLAQASGAPGQGASAGYQAPSKFKLFRSKEERQQYREAKAKFKADRRAELDKCKGLKLGQGLMKCRKEARKAARANNSEFIKARKQQRARVGIAVGAAAAMGVGAAALGTAAGRALKK